MKPHAHLPLAKVESNYFFGQRNLSFHGNKDGNFMGTRTETSVSIPKNGNGSHQAPLPFGKVES